jgi:catechol 2,3-dioxygenase
VHIELPSAGELAAVAARMRDHGVDTRDDGRAVELDDPWGNRIELSVRA